MVPICATFWNSAQICLARVLSVRTEMKLFYRRHKNKEKFPGEFTCLGCAFFWDGIEDACDTITPLVVDNLMMKKRSLRGSDVVAIYLEMAEKLAAKNVKELE